MSKLPFGSKSAKWASMVNQAQHSFAHLLNDTDFKSHAFQGMVDTRTPVVETIELLLKSKRLTGFEKGEYRLQPWRDEIVKLSNMSERDLNKMSEDQFMAETLFMTLGGIQLFAAG
jgi:hypothetical protein